jgi:hypothetical protein
MKGAWPFALGAMCGLALMALPRAAAHLHAPLHGGGSAKPGEARAHTEEKFVFTANAPMDQVVPLLGADKERVWAPGWDPQFVHPLPAVDKRGMVFTVTRDQRKSVWVNTEFDAEKGPVQYVYVIPETLITVITLQLTAVGDKTQVEVEYERTALSEEADDHVRHLAEGDRISGPDWEKQVNGYLGRVGSQ